MKQSPNPRALVATFVHPMPLTALASIGQLIEQVYGTGETTIRFADDRILIYAPADGFGPRPSELEPVTLQDASMLSQHVGVVDGELTLDASAGPEVAAAIGGTMCLWLDEFDAVNFVTMRLSAHGFDKQATFTVGRPGRPSPAELYIEARDRLKAIESALAGVDRDSLPEALRSELEVAFPTQ